MYIAAIAVFFTAVFVLQAIALYTVASREGYKLKWLAFIPVVSTYYIGVCAQKNKVFNRLDTRILSAIVALLELFMLAGGIVHYVACFQLGAAGCLEVKTNDMNLIMMEIIGSVPNELFWAEWCVNYLQTYILSWFDLLFLFGQVLLLSAYFQTYASRRYFIFTLASVIVPVQGIIFFVIRKNKGYSYRDFMRMEQERRYRTYQQFSQQNFDSNPYNNNPYSHNPYNWANGGQNTGGRQNGQNRPEDPFSEFGGGDKTDNSDPFDN